MGNEKGYRVNPVILTLARENRKPLTRYEAKLWAHLRNGQLGGWKFRRQAPIERFIPDFYCASVRLIVEVDGDSHDGREEYDAERTEWFQSNGYHVLRFTNEDVDIRLEFVLETILLTCERLKEENAVS